jgi:plasmid maintenance system antidote protein VapI
MTPANEGPLSAALRQAIRESGLSFKALEKETGVLRQSLMKFVRGEQSLRLDMADKLAVYFGLSLLPEKPKRQSAG